MIVKRIDVSTKRIAVTPIGNRLYKLAEDTRIKVYTDIGVFAVAIAKGFVTNFRSGGLLVDIIIDQIGDEKKAVIYLLHDLFYTPCAALSLNHPLSRELSDKFLKAGLLWAGMGEGMAKVVYGSVRAFGASAYEEDDALTSYNSKLFNFSWDAK